MIGSIQFSIKLIFITRMFLKMNINSRVQILLVFVKHFIYFDLFFPIYQPIPLISSIFLSVYIYIYIYHCFFTSYFLFVGILFL